MSDKRSPREQENRRAIEFYEESSAQILNVEDKDNKEMVTKLLGHLTRESEVRTQACDTHAQAFIPT